MDAQVAIDPKPSPVEIANTRFLTHVWAGLGKSFRGSITDYARTIWLGSGYLGDWHKTNLCRNCRAKGDVETCRHFEIDTARHLIGPFTAIQDPNVRVVMVLKAAQTAGSLVWDLVAHFILAHSRFLRMKVLMDSDEKARTYCTQRLMETLKANKDIAPLLPTGLERFGVTDTELRLLNGKTLFVGGLNERNASSLPADVMVIDEGWLHQSDGLMKKAFNRLKQTSTGKFIVVGQAGDVKEDQDVIWEGLDVRVNLTWACPCCGKRQQFEIHKKRPAEFEPAPPGPGFTVETPKPGTFVGFKIDKKLSELNTPEEIKDACKDTKIECYHCGFLIPDTPHYRKLLNDSYEQEYRRKAPDGTLYTPENFSVGFWQPDPASMFVSFAKTFEEFVVAEKAKEMQNMIPLRSFYIAHWAKPWDPDMDRKERTLDLLESSYETDPSKMMPDCVARIMGVDSQKKLDAGPTEDVVGSFWFVIREFDKQSNSRQIARGFVKSWEDLVARQRHWKVPNANVAIDSSKWGPQIEMVAASYFEMVKPKHPHPITGRMDPYPSCWRLFYGDEKAEFRINGKSSAISEGQQTRTYSMQIGGKTIMFKLFRYRWSNIAFELQLDAILSKTQGMPQFGILPRTALRLPNGEADTITLEKEIGILSYEQQMSARYLADVKGKQKMVDMANREAHYRDCELEILARASQFNLLGHVKLAA